MPATKPLKNGLTSFVKLEEWRREREDVLSTFWSIRKSKVAINQLNEVIDSVAKSKNEVDASTALGKWLYQELNVWNRLKRLAENYEDDIAIKDTIDVLRDILNSEKKLLQDLKAA
jgi:hypothetical protein